MRWIIWGTPQPRIRGRDNFHNALSDHHNIVSEYGASPSRKNVECTRRARKKEEVKIDWLEKSCEMPKLRGRKRG